MIITRPLFSPKEQKEMGRPLAALEQAAEREIQASPHRREEITRHYQGEADRYISERTSEKHQANYKGLLWCAAIGVGCVVLGLVSSIHILVLFGIPLFFCGIGNALWQKLKH